MDRRGIEKFALGRAAGRRGTLHVGLVNNMPDAALRATELQFAKLLKDAGAALRHMEVRLHLFSLSDIPRGAVAQARMEGFYADAATLPGAGLDALIVTDAQDCRGDLRREPYWRALTEMIDWADFGTISTYFSGLAAQAAVLHLDGIVRQPLGRKLSGVFIAERAGEDALTAGMGARIEIPHSRSDEVEEAALAARGYRLSWRLAGGGADLFTRKTGSLFVFAQGHPEYDGATLGRQYLRDVAAALRGEAEHPAIPENYFDRMTENRLQELAGSGDLDRYTAVVGGALPFLSWRGHTVKLFANWLGAIAAEKARLAAGRAPAIRRRA
jgi:homoserine O-succinyltransferase/O-acetyltransferase